MKAERQLLSVIFEFLLTELLLASEARLFIPPTGEKHLTGTPFQNFPQSSKLRSNLLLFG